MEHVDTESVARNTSKDDAQRLEGRKRCAKEAISARLVQARNALGFTQKRMATECDMKFPSLRDYEVGKAIPGGEAIFGYMRAGINANWILSGEGPMLLKDLGQQAPEPPPVVDGEVLAVVILALEQALERRGLMLEQDKKAHVISALYDYVQATGNTAKAAVDRWIGLVT